MFAFIGLSGGNQCRQFWVFATDLVQLLRVVAVDLGNCAADAVKIRHVGGEGKTSGQRGDEIVQHLSAAGDEGDLSTAGRKGAGGSETNPRRGSGDDEYATVDAHGAAEES